MSLNQTQNRLHKQKMYGHILLRLTDELADIFRQYEEITRERKEIPYSMIDKIERDAEFLLHCSTCDENPFISAYLQVHELYMKTKRKINYYTNTIKKRPRQSIDVENKRDAYSDPDVAAIAELTSSGLKTRNKFYKR